MKKDNSEENIESSELDHASSASHVSSATGSVVQSKELDEAIKQLVEVDKRAGKTEKRIRKLDDKIEHDKIRFIEAIGIFVALFTYISISFQILRGVEGIYNLAGLLLILLGSLIFFICILSMIINTSADKAKIYLLVSGILLIVVGWFTIVIQPQPNDVILQYDKVNCYNSAGKEYKGAEVSKIVNDSVFIKIDGEEKRFYKDACVKGK